MGFKKEYKSLNEEHREMLTNLILKMEKNQERKEPKRKWHIDNKIKTYFQNIGIFHYDEEYEDIYQHFKSLMEFDKQIVMKMIYHMQMKEKLSALYEE